MEENQNQIKKDYFLPISILVAAALIAGAIIYNTGAKTVGKPSAETITETAGSVVQGDLADDDVILGDSKAKVIIVEFGDYQCPFCGRFFSQTEPQLRKEYIETGKAKMVYRDFVFLGPESETAALATQCAGEQGKYWAYHDRIFEIEIVDGRENNGNLSVALMKSLAGELGLNQLKFDSCLDSKKYLSEIKKDYNDGVKAGVSGTPATFINGTLVSGAQPFSVFKQAIDQVLTQ